MVKRHTIASGQRVGQDDKREENSDARDSRRILVDSSPAGRVRSDLRAGRHSRGSLGTPAAHGDDRVRWTSRAGGAAADTDARYASRRDFKNVRLSDLRKALRAAGFAHTSTRGDHEHWKNAVTGRSTYLDGLDPVDPNVIVGSILPQLGMTEGDLLCLLGRAPASTETTIPDEPKVDAITTISGEEFIVAPLSGYDYAPWLASGDVVTQREDGTVVVTDAFFDLAPLARERALSRVRKISFTAAHPNAYPWGNRDGFALTAVDGHPHTSVPEPPAGLGAKPRNEQVVQRGEQAGDFYQQLAQSYGQLVPGQKTDLKHYDYRQHEPAIDKLIGDAGYQTYFAGGQYGKPDLANRNYTTKHLMVYDPTPGEGGDFDDETATRSWRKLHEFSHATTHGQVNDKYGEGRRIGKLGYHRTLREAKRAIEWEWLAAHKQREYSEQIGHPIDDATFAKELNTILHDAVHRAVTGKFTNPDEEGFVPSDKVVPLEHSIAQLEAYAYDKLGLADEDSLLPQKKQAAGELIDRAVDALAQDDGALRQQLEQAARSLLAEGLDEADVIDELEQRRDLLKLERAPDVAGATLVDTTPTHFIYRIESFDAARRLGSPAWCISRSSDTWNEYTSRYGAEFFFHIDKKKGPPADWAVALKEHNGQIATESYNSNNEICLVPEKGVHDWHKDQHGARDLGIEFYRGLQAAVEGNVEALHELLSQRNTDHGLAKLIDVRRVSRDFLVQLADAFDANARALYEYGHDQQDIDSWLENAGAVMPERDASMNLFAVAANVNIVDEPEARDTHGRPKPPAAQRGMEAPEQTWPVSTIESLDDGESFTHEDVQRHDAAGSAPVRVTAAMLDVPPKMFETAKLALREALIYFTREYVERRIEQRARVAEQIKEAESNLVSLPQQIVAMKPGDTIYVTLPTTDRSGFKALKIWRRPSFASNPEKYHVLEELNGKTPDFKIADAVELSDAVELATFDLSAAIEHAEQATVGVGEQQEADVEFFRDLPAVKPAQLLDDGEGTFASYDLLVDLTGWRYAEQVDKGKVPAVITFHVYPWSTIRGRGHWIGNDLMTVNIDAISGTPENLQKLTQFYTNVIEHELAHGAQMFLQAGKGLRLPGGLPSIDRAKYEPFDPRKDLFRDPDEPREFKDVNERDAPHWSRPVEFYPNLITELADFRAGTAGKSPEEVASLARDWVKHSGRFQNLKQTNETAWRKMVTEFMRAVGTGEHKQADLVEPHSYEDLLAAATIAARALRAKDFSRAQAVLSAKVEQLVGNDLQLAAHPGSTVRLIRQPGNDAIPGGQLLLGKAVPALGLPQGPMGIAIYVDPSWLSATTEEDIAADLAVTLQHELMHVEQLTRSRGQIRRDDVMTDPDRYYERPHEVEAYANDIVRDILAQDPDADFRKTETLTRSPIYMRFRKRYHGRKPEIMDRLHRLIYEYAQFERGGTEHAAVQFNNLTDLTQRETPMTNKMNLYRDLNESYRSQNQYESPIRVAFDRREGFKYTRLATSYSDIRIGDAFVVSAPFKSSFGYPVPSNTELALEGYHPPGDDEWFELRNLGMPVPGNVGANIRLRFVTPTRQTIILAPRDLPALQSIETQEMPTDVVDPYGDTEIRTQEWAQEYMRRPPTTTEPVKPTEIDEDLVPTNVDRPRRKR